MIDEETKKAITFLKKSERYREICKEAGLTPIWEFIHQCDKLDKILKEKEFKE